MCEQCSAKTKNYGEIAPHWWLIQATEEGHTMKPGDFGLVECNDPDFVWPGSIVPIKDPCFDLDDEDENFSHEDWLAFCKAAEELEEYLYAEPMRGHALVSAVMKAGYDPEKHGYRLSHWLTHQMALVIESNPTADDKIGASLDKEREKVWGVKFTEDVESQMSVG